MARIVQDSEDEDDFDVTSPNATPSPGNNATGKDEPATTRSKSTGETDVLRREIHNVQRQLIESPAASTRSRAFKADSGEVRSFAKGIPSSPVHVHLSNKRRKTSSVAASPIVQKKPLRRKTLKTYGSSSNRRHDGSNSESIDFETLKASDQIAVTSATKQKMFGAETGRTEKIWDLPPSIQNDFALHNPVSMFPEVDGSSTIPDNTFTQKRLIEEALSADQIAQPYSHIQTQASEASAQSLPWSEIMGTQAIKSQSVLKSSGKPEMPPPSPFTTTPKSRSEPVGAVFEPTNTPDEQPPPALDEPTYTPSGSALAENKTTSARSVKISRTKTDGNNRTQQKSVAEFADELSLVQPSVIKISRRKTSHFPDRQPTPVEPAARISEILVQSPPSTSANESRKAKKRVTEDELEADDSIAGLPRENYKPRPSRSRSTQVLHEESIDYSKRPEQKVKGGGKRRKTMNDLSSSHVAMSASEKVEAIGGMGFSPTLARHALERSSGDMDQAIEKLLSNAAPDPIDPDTASRFIGVEISPSKSRLAPDGVPPEQSTTEKSRDGSDVVAAEQKSGKDSTAIGDHRVLTSGAVNGSHGTDLLEDAIDVNQKPLAPKRRKSAKKPSIIEEQEDSVQPAEEPKEPKQEPAEETKKGRGRPRKAVNTPVAFTDGDDDAVQPVEISHVEKTNNTTPQNSPRKEVAPNNTRAKLPKADTDNGDDTDTFASTTKAHDHNPPASTPEQKVGKKTAVEHSPINKGKVPYRVGLNRRARIAPLLKIIKK
ncbi:hypothetical protein EJ08DRAFT_684164 [Tothia fuscella]|uniref:UBA domain-containing protein n=1 Tax=Tothia fuscella TaxID=1048955 RepID=A0A9P4NEB4_9PEZI|nr:hypothetical protein EJ08DRAFT_684164 [Tothia fuscella]